MEGGKEIAHMSCIELTAGQSVPDGLVVSMRPVGLTSNGDGEVRFPG